MYTLVLNGEEEKNIQFEDEIKEGDIILYKSLNYQIKKIEKEKIFLELYFINEAFNPKHKVKEEYKTSRSLNELELDEEKNTKYREFSHDDLIEIEEFLNLIKCGAFTDDDGFASEVVIGGRVVQDKSLSVSDIYYEKDLWLELKEEYGDVKIIWYNK